MRDFNHVWSFSACVVRDEEREHHEIFDGEYFTAHGLRRDLDEHVREEASTVRTKWTLACVIFLFFMRVPQFFVWSKMWSTDFGETNDDAFDGQQQQQHVGTQQAYASPGVGVRLDDVQTTETPRPERAATVSASE